MRSVNGACNNGTYLPFLASLGADLCRKQRSDTCPVCRQLNSTDEVLIDFDIWGLIEHIERCVGADW